MSTDTDETGQTGAGHAEDGIADTEHATVRVARAPDDDFVAFVETAGPYLYRTAYLLSGDTHRAEDLVQTAFERTYRVWDRVRDREPRAYARRVLVNLRIDTWRHTRREVVPGDDHLPVGTTPDRAAEVELRDALVRALARLAPQQRRVVVLRHLLDLSEADVAAELGRSVGTVKATNARALERLRGFVAEADLDAVDAPALDGAAVLRGSRAALRRRRAAQGATSGVAAVLLVWFLVGPVRVPGLGEVALPGSQWFREVTGIERLLERRDDAAPGPGLTTAPVGTAEVEPLLETFAVAYDGTATATLAEDGSYFMVKQFEESGDPDLPEGSGSSVIESVEIQGDGIPHAVEYEASTALDGQSTVVTAAARQDDRLAWVQSPVSDGASGVWAIRVREPGSGAVTVVEHSASDHAEDGAALGDPWLGLTAGRVAWLTETPGPDGKLVRAVSATALDGPGSGGGTGGEQDVATGVRTFATHDDELVVTTVERVADGTLRYAITSHRDDGRTETLRPAAPVPPGTGAYWGRELAASDQLVAWNDGATIHVLDRATGRERVFEPEAAEEVVTSLDASAGDVVWSTDGNEGTTVYLVADAVGAGRPQVVDRLEIVRNDAASSAAVAGDLVAWQVESAGAGTASLYRARFTP
ncbi:SigE family RNA polymerase sigma factor [Promicromonospora sp. NPDC019610]|uniref:SigE family RNA polymerase sigma factor n=1 Tax=Promicromonospora sp. NPDC019610 TaxID=3364405 RepID=UPI0037B86C79